MFALYIPGVSENRLLGRILTPKLITQTLINIRLGFLCIEIFFRRASSGQKRPTLGMYGFMSEKMTSCFRVVKHKLLSALPIDSHYYEILNIAP